MTVVPTIEKSTAGRLLDAAEDLMRSRGWVAVSYRDLAAVVGIRSASIHHHFATKADLGTALTDRYVTNFLAQLDALETRPDAADRLRGYLELVRDILAGGTAMCLCTRLVGDIDLLPDPMREQIQRFTRAHVAWLAALLEIGREQGVFAPPDDLEAAARSLYAEVQGAQILARAFTDVGQFDAVAERLQRELRTSPAALATGRP